MCFMDLVKAYDCVPQDVLWGVQQEYRVPQTIWTLNNCSENCVCILGNKSNSFPVGWTPPGLYLVSSSVRDFHKQDFKVQLGCGGGLAW